MAILLAVGFAGPALAQSSLSLLSLSDYLRQVKDQGPDYQSSQAAVEGYEKQSHQQDLIYSPQLLAGYNHMVDQSQLNFSGILLNNNNQTDTAGVSITDKFPFGPSLSLGYAFNNTTILGQSLASLAPGNPLQTSYYQISPVASLSVPLFKDFGGTQTSAGVLKVQYQFEAAAKGAAFQSAQALYQARLAYWNLALAREEESIREDTLKRSQKIWEWTKRRVARNLADPPDALQAEASVRVAELDLQMAQERERSARLQFNRYRNLDNEEVSEQLESLENSLVIFKVDIPSVPPTRLDLKAVEDTAKSQRAAYDEASQNIFPDITAFASWRGNGLDPNFGLANNMAFEQNHPTYFIGGQLTLSLDGFTAARVAEGYKKDYESADLAFKDKQIEVSQGWKDLKNHLLDVDKRLGMAAQIEEIQKNKANQEKTRLELGRTTQFQLLSFENDYALARLTRLSLILEKLSYLAQAQWWLSTEQVSPPR